MALKATVFLLTLNILFFSLVTSAPVPEAGCPVNGLKFGACAGLLNNLLNGVVLGTPPTLPCCSLFFGLANLESAVCLCNAIKTNLLGVNLDASASLSLLLNNCGKEVPSGFQC
ncbi:hypothetical protein SSX86_001263 [Deinandra increscens subsp. villosa]|uniref:Bifunctional inhibitor/plant lipid transfer protein/seed storage helical domain-containing protein n=1 Tax=Deinandra increscens subsp. villosa TaxID=3103831 RepID=A0AAP0HEC9_9ASTR